VKGISRIFFNHANALEINIGHDWGNLFLPSIFREILRHCFAAHSI